MLGRVVLTGTPSGCVPENSTSVDDHQHSIFTRVIIQSSFTTVTAMADMENETEIVEGGWSKEGTGPLLDVMKGMPAVVLDTAVLTEHLLVKAVGASEELLLNLPTRSTSPVTRRCFHAQVLEQIRVSEWQPLKHEIILCLQSAARQPNEIGKD
jgi:hypothetical protein